jgi:hypothetical protein
MAAQARVIRSRSSTSPPRFETLAQGRLQTYIRADLLAILIAIAWLIAVRIGVAADWFDVRSPEVPGQGEFRLLRCILLVKPFPLDFIGGSVPQS